MKINYCLPIINKQKNAIFELINSNINEYDYFEIWLDYIEGVDEEFIKIISEQLSEKAIFLFRRKNLEAIKMDFKNRIEIISLLTKTNSYLDLDILQQKEEINYIKNNKLDMKIIISYHNYQETPTDNKLNEITDIINKYNPAIIKLSTYCQKENDSIRLLNKLLELKRQNEKVIVSGMGEKGKIVKIIGALWGNEITFAPLSKEESSAPGQLTIDQLKTIHEILNT